MSLLTQWVKYSQATIHRHPGFLGFLLCILLWIAVTRWHLIGSTLIASPLEVARVIADSASGRIIRDENVFIQALATIERVLLGWSISLIAGTFVGALLGMASLAYKAIEPVVEFFRSIPPIMLFPLFLVAFNYGQGAYISTIAFGCIPLVALTVGRGFQQTSIIRGELLKVFKVSRKVRFLAQLMEVLPSCVLAARLAFSISIIVAVVSEMVFTPRDGTAIGSLAKSAEIAFHTPVLIAAVLIIGLFGYVGNLGIRKLEERLGFKRANSTSRGEV